MRFTPLLVLALAACHKEPPPEKQDTAPASRDVSIQFRALFGSIPFECRTQVSEIGLSVTTVRPTDLRLFVHDVTLTDANTGDAVPVELTAGAPWSGDGGLTLLDFESGDGFCEGGTPGMNDVVTGTVPGGAYNGVSFKIGVPFAFDHQTLEAATAPLDVAGMFVNPITGWQHFQLGLSPTSGGQTTWPVQIHAVNCTHDGTGPVTGCAADNVTSWSFPEFSPDDDTIDLDLATLLQTSDLTRNAVVASGGGGYDTPKGCQSDPNDTDCQPVFNQFGLNPLATPTFIQVR